jgi:hypothetical protein
MKRIFLILIAAILAMSVSDPAFATGSSLALVSSVPVSYVQGGQTRRAYTAKWVGDSSTGAVPPLTISAGGSYPIGGMYLLCVETAPGSVAPSATYTITVKDDLGNDLTGAQLTSNRSATLPQSTMPNTWLPVMSDLILAVTQTNAGATGTVRLIFTSN